VFQNAQNFILPSLPNIRDEINIEKDKDIIISHSFKKFWRELMSIEKHDINIQYFY